jgi:transcription-repair coupling factor (superfamily II helicase)
MSAYYQSAIFEKIVRFVQSYPKVFQMKETKEKLTMTAENISSVSQAMELLEKLYSYKV